MNRPAAHATETLFGQPELERKLLDQLLAESRLYKTSKEFRDLVEFTKRLRAFAPFNALLLQIQKPGLTYAASARDWSDRFQRTIKEKANPLIILWPFGPVALVYDVQDTVGPDGSSDLPKGIATFWASGPVTASMINKCVGLLEERMILVAFFDGGDADAGQIRVVCRPDPKAPAQPNTPLRHDVSIYKMMINRRHSPATQFCTIAHELAHLFLGHLGEDKALGIASRTEIGHATRELEAEAVAYTVAARNGVESASNRYLATFVKDDTNIESLGMYQIMRVVGQIENMLGLHHRIRFGGNQADEPVLDSSEKNLEPS